MLRDAEKNRPTDVRAMDGKAFSKGHWTKLLGIITLIVLVGGMTYNLPCQKAKRKWNPNETFYKIKIVLVLVRVLVGNSTLLLQATL